MSDVGLRNSIMKHDRLADIPVRHRFVDYVCTIGYSEYEGEFSLVSTRYADPRRTERPKQEMDIYLRVLRDPALRATLLEALVPESRGQITELREKAISERGKNYGFALGFLTLCITGYILHKLTFLLAKYIGLDWAEIVTYLPMFFAFLVIFPVQYWVECWHSRRYCIQHSHLLKTFKNAQGEDITWCKRCGLRI